MCFCVHNGVYEIKTKTEFNHRFVCLFNCFISEFHLYAIFINDDRVHESEA